MTPKYLDDLTMDEIMRRWPATIRVVLAHGMTCVGCPISAFHTVADAVREHDLDSRKLWSDLEAAMNLVEEKVGVD